MLPAAVLAQDANSQLFNAARDRLQNGSQWDDAALFVTLGVLGLLVIAVAARRALAMLRRLSRPPAVNYLTRAVDLLSLSEEWRRELQIVAERAGLQHHVAILLSPQNMAVALEQARADAATRRRFSGLCEQLFGVPLPVIAARSS